MKPITKSYLELIRLPGMFTAHADICAAFMIAAPGTAKADSFILLLLATSCFFSAGMALNDYFDAGIDSIERPYRPIPSGRVSRRSALALGLGLLVIGAGFAYCVGPLPFRISLALILAILLYDGWLKDISVVGPLAMASCRYLNFLLGLSLAPFSGWGYIPLINAIYIFGVTTLSRKETEGGRSIRHIGTAAICTACIPLITCLLYFQGILSSVSAWFLSLVLSIYLSRKILHHQVSHSPESYQKVIKELLLSIIILDTVIASGGISVFPAVSILLLYLPARYAVRLFKIT